MNSLLLDRTIDNFLNMVLGDDIEKFLRVQVIIVKLADRLHNMRTVWALHPEKAQYLADETMRVRPPPPSAYECTDQALSLLSTIERTIRIVGSFSWGIIESGESKN